MGAVSRRLPALVDAVLIVLDRNGLADVGRAVLTNNAIPTTEATSSRNQRREATLRLPTRHGLGMVPPPQLAVRTATLATRWPRVPCPSRCHPTGLEPGAGRRTAVGVQTTRYRVPVTSVRNGGHRSGDDIGPEAPLIPPIWPTSLVKDGGSCYLSAVPRHARLRTTPILDGSTLDGGGGDPLVLP